jgi:hypothetical protein
MRNYRRHFHAHDTLRGLCVDAFLIFFAASRTYASIDEDTDQLSRSYASAMVSADKHSYRMSMIS